MLLLWRRKKISSSRLLRLPRIRSSIKRIRGAKKILDVVRGFLWIAPGPPVGEIIVMPVKFALTLTMVIQLIQISMIVRMACWQEELEATWEEPATFR